MNVQLKHRRRFYPFGAALWTPAGSRLQSSRNFPYDGWMVRATEAGRVVKERIRGGRSHRSDARAQVFLALESAARCRARGMRDEARAALADAAQWRDREAAALRRGTRSDHLWSGHRAVLWSSPGTWDVPWSLQPLDLGGGMVLRDALVRRDADCPVDVWRLKEQP